MAAFGDLGLRDELVSVLEDEGLEQPTAIQQALVPVLRRRGNVVARASAGSGKTLAYILGVLDSLAPGDDTEAEDAGSRVLILRPTREAAAATAAQIVPFAHALDLAVAVPGGNWGTPLAAAAVVVATPNDALDEVRTSALKLDTLDSFVVDGAAAMQQLQQWSAVDTLLDQAPRTSQRVLVTAALTPAVEDLADRRVKRALRYPPEAATPTNAPATPKLGTLGYIVTREADKPEVLAQLLNAAVGVPRVYRRTDEGAAQLAEWLTVRGFLVGDAGDPDVDVEVHGPDAGEADDEAEPQADTGARISYDVPADSSTLAARHPAGEEGLALVLPRELLHLQAAAREAGFELKVAAEPTTGKLLPNDVDHFRAELRRAVEQEDIAAQVLVLEPLLDEFSATELAAAAVALLRSRRPAAAEVASRASAAAITPPATSTGAAARGDRGPRQATFTRLYVGVGSRDEAKPGDLVGAIAGEANVPGSVVGKIEIRDSFSIVEVQADVADQVIRAVNGTTIKGRSVRVDYDRAADRVADRRPGGGERGDRSEGGARRPVRRPAPRRDFEA